MARVCDDKVIDLIASGYNRKVLPYAWMALISGLTGVELESEEPEPIPQPHGARPAFSADIEQVVEEVKSNLKDYWRCLR